MKRQTIATIILDNLKNIKKENGFYSSAGENCFEWHEKPLDKDSYPAIIIRDSEDGIKMTASSWLHSLKIEVDILANGKNSIFETREIISDVLKTFKNIQEEISFICLYKGSETIKEQADFSYSGTRMVFVVEYETRAWEQ